MSQLYVYGEVYDRFDESIIKMHIDSELIEKAFNVKEEDADDFVESDEVQELDWVLQCMLSGVVGQNGMFNQLSELVESWKKEGAFTVELEEFSFGVAKTAKEAKLKWLSIESGESEDW